MTIASDATKGFLAGLDIDIMPKKVPTHAALDKVQPDPAQPRKTFDDDELRDLAASIKAHGVVSAISVRPAENGIHIIVFGERRWRAAKMAGLAEIPISIVDPSKINVRAVQLVENIQRSRLSPDEVANAIEELAQSGMKGTEIASQLGMTKARVSEYRAVADMPPSIRSVVNEIGAQLAYQLFGLWKKDKAAVDKFLSATSAEAISRTVIARLSEAVSGKGDAPPATNDKGTAASGVDDPAGRGSGKIAPSGSTDASEGRGGRSDAGAKSEHSTAPTAVSRVPDTGSAAVNSPPPQIIVKAGDEFGRLLLDRMGPDTKTALVAFNNGADIRSVPLAELSLFEIVGG